MGSFLSVCPGPKPLLASRQPAGRAFIRFSPIEGGVQDLKIGDWTEEGQDFTLRVLEGGVLKREEL